VSRAARIVSHQRHEPSFFEAPAPNGALELVWDEQGRAFDFASSAFEPTLRLKGERVMACRPKDDGGLNRRSCCLTMTQRIALQEALDFCDVWTFPARVVASERSGLLSLRKGRAARQIEFGDVMAEEQAFWRTRPVGVIDHVLEVLYSLLSALTVSVAHPSDWRPPPPLTIPWSTPLDRADPFLLCYRKSVMDDSGWRSGKILTSAWFGSGRAVREWTSVQEGKTSHYDRRELTVDPRHVEQTIADALQIGFVGTPLQALPQRYSHGEEFELVIPRLGTCATQRVHVYSESEMGVLIVEPEPYPPWLELLTRLYELSFPKLCTHAPDPEFNVHWCPQCFASRDRR
jgi:hypothetical protein